METSTVLEVYPYLRVKDAKRAIEFYGEVFGAVEKIRLVEPSGRVGHAELVFGNQTIMLSDEYPEFGITAPEPDQPSGMSIHLHVRDVDRLTEKAVEAGARLVMKPVDQFYGERAGKVIDPFGHEWLLGSKIEDVAPEEMQRRFTAMCEEPE